MCFNDTLRQINKVIPQRCEAIVLMGKPGLIVTVVVIDQYQLTQVDLHVASTNDSPARC
jgi:hypothetical protein